ncbi:MAG: Cys-Xaa-Xaa-Xaa repeat radical SAM target protein [Negativicutes bacterium]|nr:Cys-Xaa-Xaa-Xaa repeat radical SAM target protein [Negativicutes bacterium]
MNNDKSKGTTGASLVRKAENKMDRRDFLATAGRIIPTLGLIGLGLAGFSGTARAADCSSICTGGCQGACTGCTGSCSGTCNWACSDTCKDSCSGMTNKR